MREIKFRAWHEGNQSFVYMDIQEIWMNGVDCAICGAYSINDIDEYQMKKSDIKPTTFVPLANWEQYTGLKDKNGKEIYEGDIVKAEEMVDRGDGYYDPMIGEVVFYDSAFQVKDHIEYPAYNYYWFTEIDSEIIGNIHENPELLK